MSEPTYEQLRAQRVAENKRRLAEMNLQQMSVDLARTLAAPRRRRAPPVAPAAPALPRLAEPTRRSSRAQGRAPVDYSEAVLDALDGGQRRRGGGARKPFLGELRAGAQEEAYTQDDVDLLGTYSEPWELFVDGYDAASGKRVYDKVNGMTCHQCRQKTLGKHTACSDCNSLQGVLCGDCLFMRYGENILEVLALDAWTCPVCRDLCNCSFHRIRKGWLPTGTLYRRAIAEGYKSVAHYLVLTQLKDDQEPAGEAGEEARAAEGAAVAECLPEEPAEGAVPSADDVDASVAAAEPGAAVDMAAEPTGRRKRAARQATLDMPKSRASTRAGKRPARKAAVTAQGLTEVVPTGIDLVDAKVRKQLRGSRRTALGKVVAFDAANGQFTVEYKKGILEQMSQAQVAAILI